MLKGNVKLFEASKSDPNAALINAVKSIVMQSPAVTVAAPTVNVAAPQVRVQMPEVQRPTKWVFTMVRNPDGMLESITAEAK